MAQLATGSIAPAPDTTVSGEGQAVPGSSRHTHGALATQHRRKAGRRVELRHALTVPEPVPEPEHEREPELGGATSATSATRYVAVVVRTGGVVVVVVERAREPGSLGA